MDRNTPQRHVSIFHCLPKCTAYMAIFLILCPSVLLDSLTCSFTSISFLTYEKRSVICITTMPIVIRKSVFRVPLVEQELPTLPEHMRSPSVFSGVRVTRSLVLCVCLQIFVCPFVLFLLAIVLSVLLRCTDSDYPFGIFKLLLILFQSVTFHK